MKQPGWPSLHSPAGKVGRGGIMAPAGGGGIGLGMGGLAPGGMARPHPVPAAPPAGAGCIGWPCAGSEPCCSSSSACWPRRVLRDDMW